ncbi:RNA helicase SDE3 [Klebsormidium nitens]|uniref:RNA helicase n=1 Tax=Klebsormidium nitens TaxID=105231 RepID=A0A1Y1HZM8_KLENI|nr:RNA helicase SDE3 [Klebsormidium nitens]|eukprot:GAQ81308.1 RNA helicase SDE3 [Klebsormidium nitens]
MGRKKRPLAPQANKSSVFNRLCLGAASRDREVDANLTVSVRVDNAASRVANTGVNRTAAATQHQSRALPGGLDLRARINARKGEREAEAPEGGGGQSSLGETRKIGEALASRLGKRKATTDPETFLGGEDGGGSAGRRIAISDRSGLPEITIRSPKQVKYRASANDGHELATGSKQKTAPLGRTVNGVQFRSSVLLLCPLCDVVCTDLLEHNLTPGHVREDEKQRRTGVFRCKRCVVEFSEHEELARHVMSPEHRERAERRIRHALEEGEGLPVDTGDRQRSSMPEAGRSGWTLEAGGGRRDGSLERGRGQLRQEGAVGRVLKHRESQEEEDGEFESSEYGEDLRLEDSWDGRSARGGDRGGQAEFRRPFPGSAREPVSNSRAEPEQGSRMRSVLAERQYTLEQETLSGARRGPERQTSGSQSLHLSGNPAEETRGGVFSRVGRTRNISHRPASPRRLDGEVTRGSVLGARHEPDSPPQQTLLPQRGRANERAKSLELWERSGQKRKAEFSERMLPGTSGRMPPGTEIRGASAQREISRLPDRLENGGGYPHRADSSQGPGTFVEDDRFRSKRPRQNEDHDNWRQRRDGDEGVERDGRSRREEDRNRLGGGLREAEILTRAAPRTEQGREGATGRVREEKGEQRSFEPEREVFHDAEEGDWPESEPEPIYEEWHEEFAGSEEREPLQRAETSGDRVAAGEENGLARTGGGQEDWLELRLAPTHVNEQEGNWQISGVDRELDERGLADSGALTERWAGGEETDGGDRSERYRSTLGRGGRGKDPSEKSDSGPPGFQTERTFGRRSGLVSTGPEFGFNRSRLASGRTGSVANGREIVNGRTGTSEAFRDGVGGASNAMERGQGRGEESAAVYGSTEAADRRSELVRKAIERRAQTGKVIRGELPRGVRPGVIDDEGFEVPAKVQEAVERGANLPEIEAPLSMDNYYDKMATLYHVEEAQMQLDITEFDQVVTLQTSGRGLVLEVPGLAERKPSVAKGDKILLSKGQRGGAGAPKYLVYAHDVDLAKRAIFTQQAYLDPDRDYLVQFTVRREPIVRAVRSLQLCGSAVGSELRHLLFPEGSPDHLEKGNPPRFEPRDTVLNTEQKHAVGSIVLRTVDARKDVPPFVIFGPPGTGKTKTMVESIVQVREARPDARILVCAPSNSAADNLLEQLYNSCRGTVHRDEFKADVIRINSAGRPKEGVGALPVTLADFATYNPSTGFYTVPHPKTCTQHVFITTCSAAALLQQRSFPRGFFSHIFIDEAGHAVEPECFVPLACFATRETVVALAGDHQQLGPVVRSPLARKYGLGVSYLERLCGLPLYCPEDDDGRYVGYRTSVIRKLVRNYRSHPDILQIPSEVFYHGELDASADEEARESLSTWRELPTKGFPIIFHGLASADDREGDSPSWYNEGEHKQMMWYIDRLLDCRKPRITQFDIGVVAPYRRQVQKFQRLLDAQGRSAIRVGTVEEFQGQEKRVIIVSTVRAEHGADGEPRDVPGDVRRGLGFLGNRKRFNVAMTRAKELLIIVGNPHVLKQDPLWARMLRYCIFRGGYQSKHCPPPPNEEIDVRLEAGQGLANGEGSGFEGHVESPEWPEPV